VAVPFLCLERLRGERQQQFAYLKSLFSPNLEYGRSSCMVIPVFFFSCCTPCDGKFLEKSWGQEECLAAVCQCLKGVLRVWDIIFTGLLSQNSLSFLLGNDARLVEKRWLCGGRSALLGRPAAVGGCGGRSAG